MVPCGGCGGKLAQLWDGRQSPAEAPGGRMAFCAVWGLPTRQRDGAGVCGHFQRLRAMHDLFLPQHSPIPGQSVTKVMPTAGREPAARLSVVYESTKLSQQAFSILFICVSPLSSFYFP